MVFWNCQVHAMTLALPSAETSLAAASMTMADCHDQTHVANKAGMNCHGVCQHLVQHNDVAKKLATTDVSPTLLAIAPAYELMSSYSAQSTRYTAPEPLSASPPALLRFQRFLE